MEEREQEQAAQLISLILTMIDSLLTSNWSGFGVCYNSALTILQENQEVTRTIAEYTIHPETLTKVVAQQLFYKTNVSVTQAEEYVKSTLTRWKLTGPTGFWESCIEVWDANFKPKQEESATD